jgi:hypothetical protein
MNGRVGAPLSAHSMLLAICLSAGGIDVARAQTAPPDCATPGTTVVYANGIDNTIADAYTSLRRTEALYSRHIQSAPGSRLQFELAFNPSGGYGLIDLLESLDQLLDQPVPTSLLLEYVLGRTPPPAQVAVALARAIGQATAAPVLSKHVALYRERIATGDRVIVFAHSQGNFFTNDAFGQLSAVERPHFGVIAVATPAASVAGGGAHVTLNGDFIWLVPGALPANSANSNPPGDGHNYLSYYSLRGTNARLDIEGALTALDSSIAYPAFDETGCEPPPQPTNCVPQPGATGCVLETFSFSGLFRTPVPATYTSDGETYEQFGVTPIFDDGRTSTQGGSACRIDGRWLDSGYSTQSTGGYEVVPGCTGSGTQNEWRGSVSVIGGILVARSSTSETEQQRCEDAVGIWTRDFDRDWNSQYTISLESGAGGYSSTNSSTGTQTATDKSTGESATTNFATSTIGRASWGSEVFGGPPFARSVRTLTPGESIPARCLPTN